MLGSWVSGGKSGEQQSLFSPVDFLVVFWSGAEGGSSGVEQKDEDIQKRERARNDL